MEENYLKKSLAITAIVAGVLLVLSLFPEFSVGSLKIKKINLLADIRKDPPPPVLAKKITPVVKKKTVMKQAIKTTCPPGVTCIEDFQDGRHSLSGFFSALHNTGRSAARIAFFGDSFIEGDILCGSFRDTLQGLYGGQGVGYVPITSEVAQYRTTIQHAFKNWKTFSIVGAKDPASPVGTAGYCFVPLQDNEVEYKPARKKINGRFNTMRIFYKSTAPHILHYNLNDTSSFTAELPASDSLQQLKLPQRDFAAVKFNVIPADSIHFYGASFESPTGIYVDNFSMRGNSGMGLFQVERAQHQQFNRFRDYKLILLQYGLNVVSETDSNGYAWYTERMVRVITQLQEAFPQASFLLLSVSDRSSNQDGKFATMPNIPLMRDAQREVAVRCKIAFWDLYTAMGGKNSMLDYVKATPPLAAKDYTHLTYWGGKKIARKLADALLAERKRYESKK